MIKSVFVVLSLLVAVVVSQQQPEREPLLPLGVGANRAGFFRNQLTPSELAVTLRSINENIGDGNYRYEYETSDGTRVEQAGILKGPDPLNPEGVQAVQGSYSYISPEGIPITVNYIADENGFQPIGEHIPGNNLRRLGGAGIPPNPLALAGASPLAAAAAAQRISRPSPTADPELAAAVTAAPGLSREAALRNPYNRFPGFADPYNRLNPYTNPYNTAAAGFPGRFPGYAGYNQGLGLGFPNRISRK